MEIVLSRTIMTVLWVNKNEHTGNEAIYSQFICIYSTFSYSVITIATSMFFGFDIR